MMPTDMALLYECSDGDHDAAGTGSPPTFQFISFPPSRAIPVLGNTSPRPSISVQAAAASDKDNMWDKTHPSGEKVSRGALPDAAAASLLPPAPPAFQTWSLLHTLNMATLATSLLSAAVYLAIPPHVSFWYSGMCLQSQFISLANGYNLSLTFPTPAPPPPELINVRRQGVAPPERCTN